MSGISTDYNFYNSNVNSTGKTADASKNLDVNDFMNLLVKQLTNQDVMNPSSDTEFIAQMAQFTSLQATQSMNNVINSQYATAMIGKNVSVASVNALGKTEVLSGKVDAVNISGGECKVVVDGVAYDLSAISKIQQG